MLEKFQEIIESKEVNEGSLDITEKRLQEHAYKIYKIAEAMKKGVNRKKVIQELGKGYEKDFNEISELLMDAYDALEEIIMDVQKA